MAQDKLKILCIHGYRQNAKTFRERTGAYRKITKKYAELVFIDAPNIIPCHPDQEGTPEADQRGWWFSREDDYFHAKDPSDCIKGFDVSLEEVKNTVKTQGPFDGILGFSQGAAFVALLCGLQEQQPEECGFHFSFAILVAGFKSKSTPHDPLFEKLITIPSLHIIGNDDIVISKDMSGDLLAYFKSPQVIRHNGGHFIPASPLQKPDYIKFFQLMLDPKHSNGMNDVD